MNIHPFIVHFPVAFLSVYSLMELVRIRFITSTAYWFYIKASLVIIGTLGAGAAYKSGDFAKELLNDPSLHQLIEIHSKWAKLSTVLFGLIAALYAVAWLSRLEIINRIENYSKLNEVLIYAISKKIINYLVESFLMILPALIGLVAIVITGALGGVIVYGPDVDPFARIIYDLMYRF